MRKAPDLAYIPTDIFFILPRSLDGVATIRFHSTLKIWYQASTQNLALRGALITEYSRVCTRVPSVLYNESSDFGLLVGMDSYCPYAN